MNRQLTSVYAVALAVIQFTRPQLCAAQDVPTAAPSAPTAAVPSPIAESESSKEHARRLFIEASAYGQKEEWRDARSRYRESLALHAHALTLYNIALCSWKLGELSQALTEVQQALAISQPELALSEPHRAAASVLQGNIEQELRDQPATVASPLSAAETSSKQAENPVVPSTQHAAAELAPEPSTANGPSETAQDIPQSAPPPPSQAPFFRSPTAQWILGSGLVVASVGTIGAVTFGVLTANASAELSARCPTPTTCDPADADLVERYQTWSIATNISLGVAGIGAATAVTMLIGRWLSPHQVEIVAVGPVSQVAWHF